MDGHNSHLSTRIIKHCMDHGIHLECLPPHTTTILQPLDVFTFSKLKNNWRKLLSKHFQQTNSQAITKQKFALLVSFLLLLYSHSTLLFQISNLFKNYLLPGHCSGGFAKAGIYPFDKRAISQGKLLKTATVPEPTSISQSHTTDDINDNSLITTNPSRLCRSSSCPDLSLAGMKQLCLINILFFCYRSSNSF